MFQHGAKSLPEFRPNTLGLIQKKHCSFELVKIHGVAASGGEEGVPDTCHGGYHHRGVPITEEKGVFFPGSVCLSFLGEYVAVPFGYFKRAKEFSGHLGILLHNADVGKAVEKDAAPPLAGPLRGKTEPQKRFSRTRGEGETVDSRALGQGKAFLKHLLCQLFSPFVKLGSGRKGYCSGVQGRNFRKCGDSPRLHAICRHEKRELFSQIQPEGKAGAGIFEKKLSFELHMPV
jgi:hypothetical protein